MTIFRTLIVLLTAIGVSAQAQNSNAITYSEDNSLFANPETGGLYNFYSTGAQVFLDPVSYITYQLTEARDKQGCSTVFLTYYLGEWKYQAIPQWALDQIADDLATLRSLGLKAIPHFHYAYEYEYNNPQVWEETELDAPKDVIIQHCQQLEPIWRDNVDVLAVVDYGMIGPWGEMWISGQGNLGTDEGPSPHRNANDNTREIVDTWMATVPSQRTVMFSPTVKRQLYGNDPLTETEAFSGSDKSRMGFENQCFLTDTDSSDPTYENLPYRGPTSYLAEDGLYIPQIGFTDDNCGYKPTAAELIQEITKGHWDLMSIGSLNRVLSSEQDRLSVIKNTGYRFRLVQASLQQAAKPGDAVQFSFSLKNDNGGTLYNPRGFELVLRHQATSKTTKLPIEKEKGNRLYFPSSKETKNYDFTVGISPQLAEGDYEVLLNFPDPEPAIYDNPAFSIRLANQEVWEATTGYNRLLHTLTIDKDAPGVAYAGDQWFGEPGTVTPQPAEGTGLSYALYNNRTLSGIPLSTGTDATVNFDWQREGPAPSLPKDNFSVRWQGQVQPTHSEEYTFFTQADDGTRLWVNGQLLIDDWTNHAVREKSGTIRLQAGQKYDIKLEYFENGGQAVCKLLWKSESQGKQVVPIDYLYPEIGTSVRTLAGHSKEYFSDNSPERPTELLYPNPSTNGSFVIAGIQSDSRVRLYNLQGQRIAIRQQPAGNQQLKIQPQAILPPGLYVVRIQHDGGTTSQHRLSVY